jgi:hypothetical protein
MSGELEHLLSSKSALLSPPSLRLRRRCARHPATSVTCGSMHRCGYTVLPVGSTKPHKAVSSRCRLPLTPLLPLRLARDEPPPLASPPSLFAAAFVGLIVVCERGGGGEERWELRPLPVAECLSAPGNHAGNSAAARSLCLSPPPPPPRLLPSLPLSLAAVPHVLQSAGGSAA